MATAVVNKIVPFSSVDGPGNRTAVFLQGCNINCKYCHNPETRSLCNNCGKCVDVCPVGALESVSINGCTKVTYQYSKCVGCDNCTKTCPFGSSPKTRQMTAEEVFEAVKRQMPFIRGVTVSGGECMLWPQFVTELFALAKGAGLHTLVDSNGTVLFEKYPQLLQVTDGVMLDIKAFEQADHQNITDHGNSEVLQNAKFLAKANKLQEVRIVVVPSLCDVEQNVRNTAKFVAPLQRDCSFTLKLISFRPQGVREQYKAMQSPSAELMQRLAAIAKEEGIANVVLT